MGWTEIETSTHQDHVIKHVLGATVLGWIVAGEAAHLLLDIGFLWTIYLEGEMNLLPKGVAISELEGDEITSADRTELAFDADLLMQGGNVQELKQFTAAPVDCLITSVDLFADESTRLVIIRGETASLNLTTSIENGEVRVSASEDFQTTA